MENNRLRPRLRAGSTACLFFLALFLFPTPIGDLFVRTSTAFLDQNNHRLFRFDAKASGQIRLGDAGQVAVEMSSVGIPLANFKPDAASTVSVRADAIGGCSLSPNLPTVQWVPTEGRATDFGWYIGGEKAGACTLSFNFTLPAYGFVGFPVKIEVDDSPVIASFFQNIPGIVTFICTILTAVDPARKAIDFFKPKPPPPPNPPSEFKIILP